MTADDPGATPTTSRAPAPDLARGGMLLLIALANVHLFGYGSAVGVRGYPRGIEGPDRAVTLLQMTLVDGRAYPLFGLLFGYGVVQLARRRAAAAPGVAVALVRRRGLAMIAIGLVHGLLLFSGDIVGAYGLLAVLMAGHLVRGAASALLATAGSGLLLSTLLFSAVGFVPPGDPQSPQPSIAQPDAGAAALARAFEWATSGFPLQALGLFGAVALGAWAARRRLLDEPQQHRALLARVAAAGLVAGALGGLPLALMAAGLWTSPPTAAVLLAGALHALTGYVAGAGYAAAFGLLAIRLDRTGGGGPFPRALRACGQRSLSCYLAQSVAFVALLPAWSAGLGEGARLWQTALVGLGAWLVILLVAAASDRAGLRGPAEVLLRRLTYGPRRAQSG